MDKKISIVFFGSFGNYSVIVLDKLLRSSIYHLASVITTPPAPKGRHLKLTKTEVQIYAESHNISVFTPPSLDSLPAISKPDFIVVAGYGKLLSPAWLKLPKVMAINLHPSLLPAYPGRCPAEWAILRGETKTGVTLIQMTDKFDAGPILAQEKLPITTDDTRLTLYDKLFHLGADLLVRTLPNLSPNPSPESGEGDLPASRQEPRGEVFYARQITRQDGFALWDEYQLQKNDPKSQLFTKYRAFAGWPGVWTLDPSGNRIIFRLHHP